MVNPEARVLETSDLEVGKRASFERHIGAEEVALFANLTGDHNPLHINARYAAQTNYGRPIVHGALQTSLASTMAGMYLPGRNVVIGTVRSRFPVPLYIPADVRVEGEITAWLPGPDTGTLRVRVIETTQSTCSRVAGST